MVESLDLAFRQALVPLVEAVEFLLQDAQQRLYSRPSTDDYVRVQGLLNELRRLKG